MVGKLFDCLKRSGRAAAAVLLLLTSSGLSLLIPSASVSALTGGDFNAGHIIDDSVFTNQSLNVGNIQSFLNGQQPNCDTNGTKSISYWYNGSNGHINVTSDGSFITTNRATYGQRYADWWNNNTSDAAGRTRPGSYIANQSVAPYVCIQSYAENPSTGQNNLHNPTASIPGGQSAAQIIWNAGQTYGINPEVILVTLQKEQGLISDDWPWANEYSEAMGYNCPDTPQGCSGFAGFADQVNSAAKQYRHYLTNPNEFNYTIGNNNILYAPTSQCSASSIVNIQNQATAALYDYTPYQPDNNVLAHTNPTGSTSGPGAAVAGDNCGAYGNRNFWWYFNTWFGSSLAFNVAYNWHSLAVDSTGDTVTIPVTLTQQPSAPVQITFAISDTSRAQIIVNQSLFYNPSNWNSLSGHSITIKGLNSSSGSAGFTLSVSQVISDDGRYSNEPLAYYSKQPMFWQQNSERAVYRLYKSSINRHAYTVSASQKASLLSSGYTLEGTVFYQCDASSETPLMVSSNGGVVGSASDSTLTELYTTGQTDIYPSFLISNGLGKVGVHLLRNINNSNDTLLTTSDAESNQAIQNNGFQSVAYFFGCEAGNSPIYRMFSPASGDHFYTTNAGERDFAVQSGYSFEGAAFYLGDTVNTPVYRLYSPRTGDHFYTELPSENSSAQQAGYQAEGVGFSLGASNTEPIFRLFNPASKKHFYTASTVERTAATSQGYQTEGTAFTAP